MVDNLELIRKAREDADGWERESLKYVGRQHFSYAGVARIIRDLADALERRD